MGNRAVLAFVKEKNEGARKKIIKDKNTVGIYLHWNGGRDSVEGFLNVAKEYGIRSANDSYGIARLTQIISNFLGGTLSIGVGIVKNLDCDNYDNGVYWIDKNYNIVDREYYNGKEQSEYSLKEIVSEIKMKNDNHFISEGDINKLCA